MLRLRSHLYPLMYIAGIVACPFFAHADPAPPSMRYAPPPATFDGGSQLQLLQDAIDRKEFAPAAARLEALLRDSADALLPQGDDGSVLSVAAWAMNLPADTKAALAPPYESSEGIAARQAVGVEKAKPDAEPADFYALAQRYFLCHAAAPALAEGARRSALLGDVPSARWMLTAATAQGFPPDPILARAIDESIAPANAFSGPLPFAAPWYGARTRLAWAAIRSFPGAAGATIFVVGPGQVVALKQDGSVLWTGPIGAEPIAGRGASAPMGVTRGPPLAPAILCDATGEPQLLVVRQPEVHGTGWALRALRASDGHLLWTTENKDDLHGLVFGSNPAIEGRYVYAIAGDVADELDHLSMVALEVTTGRQLWRCDIGTESRTLAPRARNEPPTEVYRPWLNESAPAVAGDVVIAAPNVGAVIAVGRFDGKLRWIREYPTLSDPTAQLQRQRQWALEHPNSIAPMVGGLSQRWTNTPAVSGDVVVSAPEDSDAVIGVNIHDGKQIWQNADLPDATLVGASRGIAVMVGKTASALNAASGALEWKRSDPISGPAILRDDSLIVPTLGGVVAVTAHAGSESPVPDGIPSFARTISAPSAREALFENDVAHCFGIRGRFILPGEH